MEKRKIAMAFQFGTNRSTIEKIHLSKTPERDQLVRAAAKEWAVEKADEGGTKRRYLYGISSGVKLDGHAERMTEKCIKGMLEQANRGELLLYPDVHGIRQSEDIGRLTKAWMDDASDWHTEYRIYDEQDLKAGYIGPQKLEKANTIWRQINGLPPYNKPLQKGFSIEGIIPDDGILEAKKDALGNLTNRVIDRVDLDGVCLVPKPAYLDGVAHAAYKALGEITPFKAQAVRKQVANELQAVMAEQEIADQYYNRKCDLEAAMDKAICRIMGRESINRGQELQLAFDEYGKKMSELILASESVFAGEGAEDADQDSANPYGTNGVEKTNSRRLILLKTLEAQLTELKKSFERRTLCP